MPKRVTRASSGSQKRQVRLLQQRLERQGMSHAEAQERAQTRSQRLGRAGARQGGRIISKETEAAALAARPNRKRGIKGNGRTATMPRRLGSKRVEAATANQSLGKRPTKSRK